MSDSCVDDILFGHRSSTVVHQTRVEISPHSRINRKDTAGFLEILGRNLTLADDDVHHQSAVEQTKYRSSIQTAQSQISKCRATINCTFDGTYLLFRVVIRLCGKMQGL